MFGGFEHTEELSPENAAIIKTWGEASPFTEELPECVGNSNPFMNLAKFYHLDYGTVLLFADSMKKNRTYSNPVHEQRAIEHATRHLTGSMSLAYFEHHVRLILQRIGQA